MTIAAADGLADRFPGFDVLAQSKHWDATTRELIEERLATTGPLRFFSLIEAAAAGALFDQLLDQRAEPRIPVLEMIDARMAKDATDGWRYASMPMDTDAWHQSLAALDADAVAATGRTFPGLDWDTQAGILQAIHDLDGQHWHGMPAAQVWGLWTRYSCTAYYSHPAAWQELGFAGPAYPRGYKNIGIDRLEPFEVRDAHPELGPGDDQ